METGTPYLDPTANVLGLVAAAVTRLDDLREAEARAVRELIQVRGEYEERLRIAESKRIDAIRAVDVAAVTAAATAAEVRATALAVQVETTAKAASAALTAALEPLMEAVADLRRVQYEQQGQKSQKTETRASLSFGQSILVVGILLVSTTIAVYAAVHRGSTPTPSPAVVCTLSYHPTPCPQP